MHSLSLSDGTNKSSLRWSTLTIAKYRTCVSLYNMFVYSIHVTHTIFRRINSKYTHKTLKYYKHWWPNDINRELEIQLRVNMVDKFPCHVKRSYLALCIIKQSNTFAALFLRYFQERIDRTWSEIIFAKGELNATRYQDMWHGKLLPFITETADKTTTFWQDNAAIHTAATVKKKLVLRFFVMGLFNMVQHRVLIWTPSTTRGEFQRNFTTREGRPWGIP